MADANQLKEALIVFRFGRGLRLADKHTDDPLAIALIEIIELSRSYDFSDALKFHRGLRYRTGRQGLFVYIVVCEYHSGPSLHLLPRCLMNSGGNDPTARLGFHLVNVDPAGQSRNDHWGCVGRFPVST